MLAIVLNILHAPTHLMLMETLVLLFFSSPRMRQQKEKGSHKLPIWYVEAKAFSLSSGALDPLLEHCTMVFTRPRLGPTVVLLHKSPNTICCTLYLVLDTF